AKGAVVANDAVVYGEPVSGPDGALVVPVACTGRWGSRPVGVFVVHDGKATWTPAVDVDRVLLVGSVTGLLAAVLGCLAVLKRPPWPDLSADGLRALRRRS